MKRKILAFVMLLAVVPSVAFADFGYFENLISQLKDILNSLVPLLIAAAVVYFLWGVLQFVGSGDDQEKRKAGRSIMIHGIIAIFVMVSLWGFVDLLRVLFDIPDVPPPPLPSL